MESHPRTLPERVAAEVRAVLAREGITRAAVATATELPKTSLARRLAGVRPFTVAELDAIGRLVGVTGSELLARAEAEGTEAA